MSQGLRVLVLHRSRVRFEVAEQRGAFWNEYVRFMGILINLRHERFAQALAQGKAANEAYALAGYKANDGNASRMKGNERISARAREIVGRAAERAEVSRERTLRELAAIAFSDITKAVTWGVQVREEEDEHGERVKVIRTRGATPLY
jgi:phage terminase small subunit